MSTVKDMETQPSDLYTESTEGGTGNIQRKSKQAYVYVTNFATDENVIIEDQGIERVEKYNYLDQTRRLKECPKEEVLRRIKLGVAALEAMKKPKLRKYMSLRRKPMCPSNNDACVALKLGH